MKVIIGTFFGLLALGFLTDYYVMDKVYDSAGRAIEHSLDAGIIKSGKVEDAQQGIVRLEQSALKDAIRSEFQRNMGLSNALENKLMKDSQFDLYLEYEDGVPWIQVEFHTHVSFSFPDIKYPVRVRRKIAFESIYK